MLSQGRGSSLITVTVSNGSDLSLLEIKRNHTDTIYPLPSYTFFIKQIGLINGGEEQERKETITGKLSFHVKHQFTKRP